MSDSVNVVELIKCENSDGGKKNRVSETTTSLKDFCDFKDH